jgi:hypothetical protein
MTSGGGLYNQGVIFKYVPVNTAISESIPDDDVYPNPTTGILNIHVPDLIKTEVINPEGILAGTYYGTSIDISSLPAGMYIINIYNTGGLLNRVKIILSK